MFDQIVMFSAGFTALSAAVVLLWKILRTVARVASRLDHAWDDWAGTGERPGVIPRLNRAEGRISALEQPPT